MACRWCVHWVAKDRLAQDEGVVGQCRRYPRPEETISEYRCGEFVCEPNNYIDSHGSNIMNMYWKNLREFRHLYDTERKARIALQKKLKTLRKEKNVVLHPT